MDVRVFGDYMYLFYVHKYLDTLKSNSTQKGLPLRLSNARIQVFSKGSTQPLHTLHVPVLNETQMNREREKEPKERDPILAAEREET